MGRAQGAGAAKAWGEARAGLEPVAVCPRAMVSESGPGAGHRVTRGLL
jgi:hypothetical protein